MVLIIDKQTFCPIDHHWIEDEVNIFLEKLDLHEWQVSIVILESSEMADYNSKYRGKMVPTDVLSFPFFPDLKPGEKPEPNEDHTHDLGDIVICPEKIDQDAREIKISFELRLKRIMAHGLAHLLGYDHKIDEEYVVMKALEEKLMGEKINDDLPVD